MDAHGAAVSGYRVVDHSGESVDCGPPRVPSPAATSANILWCTPTADYAIACWPSAASTVLCLRDVAQRELDRFRATGVGPVAAPSAPLPFALLLTDGTRCQLRDGGAWSQLTQHPSWSGWYSCGGADAVWAARPSSVVDTSRAQWTVQVAPIGGLDPVHTAAVRTAYFVATSA